MFYGKAPAFAVGLNMIIIITNMLLYAESDEVR